jgi:hypothetical protein
VLAWVENPERANKRCEKRSSFYTKKILLTSLDLILYKSLSVKREDWKELGMLADKTNRTRSSMIGRLIRFFKDNKGNGKKNGKSN